MKSSAEIRSGFLNFFSEKNHEIVRSSSLVPGNDPTLLFTNAGMVQFKDVFLGAQKRRQQRATSSQRCVRAGGKHNDLDQVGYTARHHTFFEMLGNFSFGDYFKHDAICYAWEFLTEVVGLPVEHLWITVYEEDDEAADIWLNEIGVAPDRLSRIGAKDNFWAMGDTGPCGPCTEIFYDHGPDIPGGPPGTPEEDGDRYIEIWNLVFMQFDRDAEGTLHPLPSPCVDTGMGLERLAAIIQGVHNNYDIDLFAHLIKAAAGIIGCDDLSNQSLRVIADHIRACSFLIVDGVLPSNEGRGYVLRRIIRRAVRHGNRLGAEALFFNRLVDALIEVMGEAYPELTAARQKIIDALRLEEERFAQTLENGMRLLNAEIETLQGTQIPGETVFKLYDTYGFPVDLTADIARERGLTLDREGFETAMAVQRRRARSAASFDAGAQISADMVNQLPATVFTGYEHGDRSGCEVQMLIQNGQAVDRVQAGESAMLLLDRTPFYAESGGQVGDQGQLLGEGLVLQVTDTQKVANQYHAHLITVESGSVSKGDRLDARINGERRQAIVLNHSATHLLHAAMHKILGEHVRQKGSLVDADRLRFDFSHPEPVTADEIVQIEHWVNQQVRQNRPALADVMAYDDAIDQGAMALFGEKYGNEVRVLSIGDQSTELCGGTHVERAGDIGLFKITSESGIASGIRRIEAVTGDNALQWVNQRQQLLSDSAALIKAAPEQLTDRLTRLFDRNRELEKQLQSLQSKLAGQSGTDLLEQGQSIGNLTLIAVRLDDLDVKQLRETVDRLKDKLERGVILLATVQGEKISLIAGVTKDATNQIKAGDLVNHVAQQVGGRGGGRPDLAQAGGSEPANLTAAIDSVAAWVSEQVA